MNTRSMAIGLLAASLSWPALADHGWGHRHHHHHGHGTAMMAYPGVVMYPPAPTVIYAPPQVIYRDRIVYQPVPAYPADDGRYYGPPVGARSAGSGAGPVVGAVAGGILGNQIGQGNGRTAATAVGAAIGAIVGERLSY